MKFYAQTPAGRRAQLTQEGALSAADAAIFAAGGMLDETVASKLVENQIGQFAVPLGVARNLTVNGRVVQVPMVTEEPSVIAAASNGARLANLSGGVHATAPIHEVIGEIVFDQLPDPAAAIDAIATRQTEIMAVAQAAHPSIVARGGGVLTIDTTQVADFLKIRLHVDPQAAMGANIVNTIAEAVGQTLGDWFKKKPLVAILSNASAAVATATVELAVSTLDTTVDSGETVARRIVRLSALAQMDHERAVTHNKGIMNGITAAVLASGNDTRAVEAAAHAHAARSGQYQPLSTWTQPSPTILRGTLGLPLPVGIVGGAISALPVAQAVGRLGGYANVAAFQETLAALGLVQNLAALRALAGPGIQAGHMALAANALAIAAGATGDEIAAVSVRLRETTQDLATAQALVAAMRKGE